MQYIYHIARIARKSDWKLANKEGWYTVSTLNKTLEEVGFIHCSFKNQLKLVSNSIYSRVPDLVLLEIDTGKLKAPVKVEEVGEGYQFPHIYGPLNINAVVGVEIFQA